MSLRRWLGQIPQELNGRNQDGFAAKKKLHVLAVVLWT